jgi:hypothetical protein
MPNPTDPIVLTLTANLSGDPTNPAVSLVASGTGAGCWDFNNQKLNLPSTHPPTPANITFAIGSSTITGNPAVSWDSNQYADINIKYKNNPNRFPPNGLFAISPPVGQTFLVQDANNDGGGDYSFYLIFNLATNPPTRVGHDPEIQNGGSSTT